MKKKIIFSSTIIFFVMKSTFSQSIIQYSLSIAEPHTHYVQVEIELKNPGRPYLDFKMPVWTPGSYLIREFARNVESFTAYKIEGQLTSEKINKNTWRVYTENVSKVKIKYNVYAFEHTVRTSFVDDSHATINGASIFMWVDSLQNQPLTLTVNPYSTWKKITTGLVAIKSNPWQFEVPNYDVLVDSPIEIGNHQVITFTAKNIPHQVAIVGDSISDPSQFKKDMQSITETAMNVFDEIPFSNYTFIFHLGNTRGGLEHLNSTHIIFFRSALYDSEVYKKMLAIAAHEYFHAWNVKRIRPIELGPFDYSNENYTSLLYVAEGFTEFYESYLLKLAGITTEKEYIQSIASNINTFENKPGKEFQSLMESSFDAWIKYYRPDANSNNSSISYYEKGGIVALLLNLEILNVTNGKKSVQDVFRYLYTEYYKNKKRGFTHEEFKEAITKIVCTNLDSFFSDYIEGTKPIDYNHYFSYVGLELIDKNKENKIPWLGSSFKLDNGKLIIKSVIRNSPAYINGLNENDEFISINSYRVTNEDEVQDMIDRCKINDTISCLVSRDGKIKKIDIVLTKDSTVKYELMAKNKLTSRQKKLYNQWMKIDKK